jgi:TPR repeat protein
MLCDRKKLYDECSRAAEAHELGTAGDVNPLQGKRFRKIALTYLVTACEAGDPHACFVLAAKYRAGPELKASPVRAAALEKRALELCRLRSAPECPAR